MTDTMIHTLRSTDLLMALLGNSRIGADCAQTWDKVGVTSPSALSFASLAKGLALHGDSEWYSISTDGMQLQGLASVRPRSGPIAWEVDRFCLSPEVEREGVALLERLCAVAGEHGGQRVFLRLPALSPVVGLAKEAGFIHCTQETLYRLESLTSPLPDACELIRPLRRPDEFSVFRLYNQCVPARVRLVYALTFDEWSHALEPFGKRTRQGVYETGGSLRGWARVGSDKQNAVNTLEVMAHPGEEAGVWDDLVSWGLQQGRAMSPFLSLAPYYQPTQGLALERRGFTPVREYQLMVKPMAVRVKDSALAPARA